VSSGSYLGKPKLRKTRAMTSLRGRGGNPAAVHAVEVGAGRPLCGRIWSGEGVSGWVTTDQEVSCPRCLKKLSSAG
jgi:hypothetical protein